MKGAGARRLASAIAALALASPAAARAGDDVREAARAAFMEASKLAEQRQWGLACERYSESLKLHRSALTLYSLGVAQREAGRLVAARASFEAFLAEPPTPATQAYGAHARAAVAEIRKRVAVLTIVLEPGPVSQATVTIDGAQVTSGRFAQRHTVDPGAHDIAARAPGRAEGRAHLTLAEGGSATVTLTLTPLPSGAGFVGPVASSREGGAPALPPPQEGGVPWPRPLPYVLLGTGGAAIASGVTLGLVGLADAHSARSVTGPAADEARAKGIAGDVLAGAGIVAASVGLVLLLVQVQGPPAGGRAAATGPYSASNAGAPVTRPSVRSDGAGLTVTF